MEQKRPLLTAPAFFLPLVTIIAALAVALAFLISPRPGFSHLALIVIMAAAGTLTLLTAWHSSVSSDSRTNKTVRESANLMISFISGLNGTTRTLIHSMEATGLENEAPELVTDLMSVKTHLQILETIEKQGQDYIAQGQYQNTSALMGQATESLNALRADSERLVRLYSEQYRNHQSTARQVSHHMTTFIYYLAVSIPIMTDFTKIFNEFSKELILEVINKFGDITNSSHQIADDIEKSMNSLMDENKEDSLAFIITKAHRLVVDFETFYKNMGSLKDSTDNFTLKTSEKLSNIQGMADSIEQIAETIKVLSLNVSIEAANAGSAGKGFQVLARDLREFTTKTMKFAHEVKSRVKDALSTTTSLKGDYLKSMESVYKYMEDIKNSITSFEGIITKSFDKIKGIIQNLRRFSEHIDTGIKEVVGKLQYYDITSQEVDHLGLFVEKIFMDLFNEKMVNINVSDFLKDDEKLQIKKEVLRIINEMITTANERKILSKYESQFGVSVQEEIHIDNKASSDLQSDNSSIILF